MVEGTLTGLAHGTKCFAQLHPAIDRESTERQGNGLGSVG